ncbi:MAG: hypothetical protein Fur005_05520 [Roseiflexaceae bacterium]
MRTNLVDGIIIGLGISLVILVARWFFGENQVLEQAVTIMLGGVVLAIIQLWIDRRRLNIPPPTPPGANEPAPAPPATPLATPRTPWSTDLQAAADPPAADPPAASAPATPTTPGTTPPESTTPKQE